MKYLVGNFRVCEAPHFLYPQCIANFLPFLAVRFYLFGRPNSALWTPPHSARHTVKSVLTSALAEFCCPVPKWSKFACLKLICSRRVTGTLKYYASFYSPDCKLESFVPTISFDLVKCSTVSFCWDQVRVIV